jgi:hypothetical protein
MNVQLKELALNLGEGRRRQMKQPAPCGVSLAHHPEQRILETEFFGTVEQKLPVDWTIGGSEPEATQT